MHDKFAKEGFEVIAVVTDQTKETKALAQARAFVADKLKARFLSVHVDSKTFDYDKKITDQNVPAAFVFDRDNRWVLKLPSTNAKGELEEVDYDVIEKTVSDLMKKGAK